MKKNLTLIGFAFLLSGMLLSCSNERSAIKEAVEIETSYEQVGRLHNEGLAYILERIKKQPVTRSGSTELDMDALIGYMNDFLEANGDEAVSEVYVPEIIFDGADGNTVVGYDMTINENIYFNRIVNIGLEIEDKVTVLQRMIEIENEIRHDLSLSYTERENLLHFSSVSRYSLDYWTDNMEEWITVLRGEELIATRRGFWRNLWNAAWRTAVIDGTGGVVGLVTGPGALGTALGTSLIYCADKVVSSNEVCFEDDVAPSGGGTYYAEDIPN